jgi:hypothetical protein
LDHDKVVNPIPQYKELTLDELLVMANSPLEEFEVDYA